MQAFKTIQSHVIPIDMDHIDTDMIIPAQFLTQINKDGYGMHVFARLREKNANFVWNDPSYHAAKIILTKANFGCGSSREHAVWALMQAGIKAVIAESYSDIFYNNAAKNGLLTITLAPTIIHTLMIQAKQCPLILQIDLASETICSMQGECIYFNYDSFRKECFLTGQDDLDYLLEATT